MSSYLEHKFNRKNNNEDIKPFFMACKSLRKSIFNVIKNRNTDLSIADLDQRVCTLSFAVIACNWLPIKSDIPDHFTFFDELKRLFPSRKKYQVHTHRLFDELHNFLLLLEKNRLELSVWKCIQEFRSRKFQLKEEYFGRAYEEIRKHMPDDQFTKRKDVQFVQNPSRKEHGKYYTPEDITVFMTERNIRRWSKSHGICRFSKDNLPLLLDPTVGAGAFLLAAVRIIEQRWENFENLSLKEKLTNRQTIVERCMHGLDLDDEALMVCQFSLWLLSVGEDTSYHPNLSKNFKHRDLLDELESIQQSKHGNWSDKFDIVIGNPPYVSLSQKKQAYKKATTLNLVTTKCRNLYAYTIELSLKCLKSDGVLGLIVPLSLCIGSGFSSLRKLLITQDSWLETLNFDVVPGYLFNQGKLEGTSKEAITQRCTILSLDRTKGLEVSTTERLRWTDGTDRPFLFELIEKNTIEPTDVPFSLWSKERIIQGGIPLLGMNGKIRELYPETKDISPLELFSRLHEQERKEAKTVAFIADLLTEQSEFKLHLFKSFRYYVHANEADLSRNPSSYIVLYAKDKAALENLYLYFNSNLFYWYCRVLGGEQGLSLDFIKKVPMPLLSSNDRIDLYEKLTEAERDCTQESSNKGIQKSVNFNQRQDLLLEIDYHLFRVLDLPKEYCYITFYSKWNSVTKLGPDEVCMPGYQADHHPSKILPTFGDCMPPELIEAFYKYLTSTSTAEALKKIGKDYPSLSGIFHEVVTCTTDYDATIERILEHGHSEPDDVFDIILTGSAGSGKTHLMHVLNKNDKFDLKEYLESNLYSFEEGAIPVVTITDATSDLPIIKDENDSKTIDFFTTLFNLSDNKRTYAIIIAINEGPLRKHRDAFKSVASNASDKEARTRLQNIANHLEKTLQYLRDAQYGYETEYSDDLPVIIDLASKSPVLFKPEYLAQLFTGPVKGADFRKQDVWEGVILQHFSCMESGPSNAIIEQFIEAFRLFTKSKIIVEDGEDKEVFPIIEEVFKLLSMVVRSGEQVTWRHLMNWIQEMFLPKHATYTDLWFYSLFYGRNRLSKTLRKIITPTVSLVLPDVEHLLYEDHRPNSKTLWSGLYQMRCERRKFPIKLYRTRQLFYLFEKYDDIYAQFKFPRPFWEQDAKVILRQVNTFMSYNHTSSRSDNTNVFNEFYIWWHCNVEGRRTNGDMIVILGRINFNDFENQAGKWIANIPESISNGIDSSNGTRYVSLKQSKLREGARFKPLKLTLNMWNQMHEPRSPSVSERANQEFTLTLEKFGLEVLICHNGERLNSNAIAIINRKIPTDLVSFHGLSYDESTKQYSISKVG